MMTEAEQLKIITKRSRKETHSSHASGSGADEGIGVTPGVPDAPDYDSEDDISWKSSDDDQDDEKAQDDENEDKNDVNETTQDDEDDDVHDEDENAQDDDDGEQTESEDDGDDFIHPKLTTHDDEIIHEEETDEDDSFDPTVHTPSQISSSDDEDSDNNVEGTNVEGAKSDEDATYEEDQGNEAVEDTNTNLEERDDVMIDVILPQVQATQEIEDTHVTLTPVNPDGQQQSSLKSLEDNFSELRQTNQYVEALSSIPGIVDQYLANKMQEAVDVAEKLNLTKPDTYRSNLRRRYAYTPYSDPRGFIYENKDKKNRLMRIDELHKFSDGTLDDVRTALNDRLKGIRMEYLPQTFLTQRTNNMQEL
ncbi:hypothetical protein Tco_0962839 [Tanacetum coccineum]